MSKAETAPAIPTSAARRAPYTRPTMRPHTKSAAAFAEARRFIPGGVNSPVRAFRGVGGEPFFVERAEGAHIWDVDGNELIDYVGTWGPAILGHAPREVRDAITDAASRGVSFGIPNPYEIEMARTICAWVPSIEKVRMVNSGTEATMSCIRLARGFTGRDLIVKFEGCYHGHVDALLVKAGSGALTHGQPDSAGVPAALAELTITLPFNDVTALRSLFMARGSQIAAVIVEPVPANAGLYLPREGFLEVLRQQCSQYGAVLIFDEVMTGFRLARGGYQERCGISRAFRAKKSGPRLRLPAHRLHVLPLLYERRDLEPRRRPALRQSRLRPLLPRLPRSRHLLRPLPIRSRLPLPRSHPRRPRPNRCHRRHRPHRLTPATEPHDPASDWVTPMSAKPGFVNA